MTTNISRSRLADSANSSVSGQFCLHAQARRMGKRGLWIVCWNTNVTRTRSCSKHLHTCSRARLASGCCSLQGAILRSERLHATCPTRSSSVQQAGAGQSLEGYDSLTSETAFDRF
ncbi:hypothetical protein FA10DRAFT_269881, partial [Acaromyces ingoldii]